MFKKLGKLCPQGVLQSWVGVEMGGDSHSTPIQCDVLSPKTQMREGGNHRRGKSYVSGGDGQSKTPKGDSWKDVIFL